MKKLHHRLAQRLSSGNVVPHVLLVLVAGVAAFWLLGAFVDTLDISIRRGEALRAAQQSGAASTEVVHH
jgi:hypothetical protein